jgi:hemolysin activation/secretion protein
LILGEQFRLGGADGVRGFSEGSESGNSGTRVSLEGYTPNFGSSNVMMRGLVFFDSGQVQATAISPKSSISAVGIGLRSSFARQYNLRLDMAKILNSGTDPLQRVGDWRAHLTVMVSF